MRFRFFCLFLVFSSTILFGYNVTDNYEIRRKYENALDLHIRNVENFPQTLYRMSSSGERVRFELREQGGFQYLLFTNEQNMVFPLYSAGSYIIKKSGESGRITQIKVFLGTNEDNCIRIHPAEDRSKMDIFLFGHEVYSDIYIPLPINQTALLPLEILLSMTSVSVDWNLFFPDDFSYEWQRVENFYEAALESSSDLVEVSDGAIDSQGNWVYIETLEPQLEEQGLNCSGFAKWIGDGLYFPVHNVLMDIETLKQKPLEMRGNRWSQNQEDLRDPYFGLDWTRNIATTLMDTFSAAGPFSCEDADVRTIPFHYYYEDVGYTLESLNEILYLLAVTEPGHFYMGAVNHSWGTAPILRQYTHIAIFFPWIDAYHNFHLEVLETNTSSSVNSLLTRFPDSFVHLVRIQARSDYDFLQR